MVSLGTATCHVLIFVNLKEGFARSEKEKAGTTAKRRSVAVKGGGLWNGLKKNRNEAMHNTPYVQSNVI